ncbi:MAG: IS110 family transposase [Oscillospiraceae bacterium]|nr:IS110 family transposase [Oscillospiraceae bacterium]
MNYVGIDISKYKHDCFIMTDLGEVINDGFSFTNNAGGFAMLQRELELCGKGNVRIGFEATGNYGINLKLFLERIGYDYMEINPLLIKEYIRGRTLRRTKTDKLDASAIARYILAVGYRPHRTSFYQTFALKQLTRLRSSLVSQRSRYLVQLTNVLDCIFPEFKPLFGNKFSVTALYILANYPSPQAIANMNTRSFEILRRKSRGKFTMDKFVKLKTLAKNTVGVYEDCYRLELDTLLNLYSQLDSKIDELESQITEIIEVLNPPTLSIKGVGSVSAAIIISELGDISRFKTPDKVLSFAGLEPGFFQSGTTEYNGHMVKHGSAPLRCALMNCSRSIRLHNETFAAYYQKKINEGKPHYVALSHVAKKLVRLIFALETKGDRFDPSRLR